MRLLSHCNEIFFSQNKFMRANYRYCCYYQRSSRTSLLSEYHYEANSMSSSTLEGRSTATRLCQATAREARAWEVIQQRGTIYKQSSWQSRRVEQRNKGLPSRFSSIISVFFNCISQTTHTCASVTFALLASLREDCSADVMSLDCEVRIKVSVQLRHTT